MVIFRGVRTVEVGSPPDEANRDGSDERLVTREVNRDFAISATEVSVEQFLEFFPTYAHRQNAYSSTPDCPVVALTWHRAAQYCQWLSEQDGIPADQLCYVRDGDDMIPVGSSLTHTGYRLPTEAEWEYACRAGSRTPYYWGYNPDLAFRYAWLNGNADGHPWPVGCRCPNRFGLFDMLGNVAEWTHEPYEVKRRDGPDADGPGPNGSDVAERTQEPKQDVPGAGSDSAGSRKESEEDTMRAVRGQSAISYPLMSRSANRTPSQSTHGNSSFIGFRIVRTL
jgi:formylglycine-generating enzyme required for sulfatase activity